MDAFDTKGTALLLNDIQKWICIYNFAPFTLIDVSGRVKAASEDK